MQEAAQFPCEHSVFHAKGWISYGKAEQEALCSLSPMPAHQVSSSHTSESSALTQSLHDSGNSVLATGGMVQMCFGSLGVMEGILLHARPLINILYSSSFCICFRSYYLFL